ncbi:hypothetical protein D3C77_640530 [compost metagenome]
MLSVANVVELCHKIVTSAACEITRTTGAAERTSAFGNGAVPVWTGKTSIQHDLKYFFAKLLAHLGIPGVKAFVSPELGGRT